VDVLRILFNDAPIEESNEEKPGVIFDYDGSGQVVGIEILNASEWYNESDRSSERERGSPCNSQQKF
jgi:uncharacterized protein YuzE